MVEQNTLLKKKYRELCQNENSIPLFSKDWWLDAVIGDQNWNVAVVIKGEEIAATMPYVTKTRFGFKLCTMPPFTQTLGPWFKLRAIKYTKQLAQQKDLMFKLIEQLPKYDYFLQYWNYKHTNWLPFYWKGFKQTTSYTYVIEDLTDLDKVWSGFRENIRTDIRKSTSRFNLSVNDNPNLADFIDLHEKVFERQGIKMPFSKEVLLRLDQRCVKRNARKMFIAIGPPNH